MIALLCAALGAYRLAYDLAYMDGPGALYVRARGAVIQRYGEGHWLTIGATCPVCVSFWISLPLALLTTWAGGLAWAALPLWWLGVAGGALALLKVTT